MPARINSAIRRRARDLWEVEGYSPGEILEVLFDESKSASPLGPDDGEKKEVILPQNRSVLHKWAKSEGWGSWRAARKRANRQVDADISKGAMFAISGITDPIWHLSVVEVQAYIGDMRDNMPTTWEVLRHVNKKLHPGPRVLERLRPVIRSEIKRAMETHRWFQSFDPNTDNSVPPIKLDPTDYTGELS